MTNVITYFPNGSFNTIHYDGNEATMTYYNPKGQVTGKGAKQEN